MGLLQLWNYAIMAEPSLKGPGTHMLDSLFRVRQHHALEHATMHVLSRRNPYTRLVGRSTFSGFVIIGSVDTREIADAVTEALVRLQKGEAHLAIHPRCGTNLAVTSIFAGAAAYGATLGRPKNRLDRLPLALTAATLAAILAQPVAHQIQERLTTTPEVDDLHVASISRQERGKLISHRISIGRV
jgi:hypothetical protein